MPKKCTSGGPRAVTDDIDFSDTSSDEELPMRSLVAAMRGSKMCYHGCNEYVWYHGYHSLECVGEGPGSIMVYLHKVHFEIIAKNQFLRLLSCSIAHNFLSV
eukprot:sb/3478353/